MCGEGLEGELWQVVVEPGTGRMRPGMESLSVWLPISRAGSGEWRESYSGEPLIGGGWVTGEPNKEAGRSCALLVVPWQGWVAWPCTVPISQVLLALSGHSL